MLESATIRRPGRREDRLDVGRVLDVMLYYDRVHLLLDTTTYCEILFQLGLADTKALLSHPTITASLTNEIPAIRSEVTNGIEILQPGLLQFAGHKDKIIAPDDYVGAIFQMAKRNPQTDSIKKIEIESTLKKVKNKTLRSLLRPDNDDFELYRTLIHDEDTVKMFIAHWTKRLGGNLNSTALQLMKIDVIDVGKGALISSSISLEEVFGGVLPEGVGWSTITQFIFDYSIELFLSQTHSSDLICAPEAGEIASARVDLCLQRASRNSQRIDAFEREVLNGTGLLGAAFDQGRLTLGAALNLIDRSRRMRTWVRGLPPDADILREYEAELARESPLKGLPAGIARFLLFTGGGALLSQTASVALSAFDTLLFDRLVKGWRPNVFVRDVKEFISDAE